MHDKSPFGQSLAQIRKAKGFTQKMLAEAIGVSQRVIAYYEGETDRPPASKLADIAKAMDISVDELLGLSPFKKPRGAPKNAYLNRKLQKVGELPKDDQKVIIGMIEALAAKKGAA
jgi:transcriptional regulator with XRE-family HTH domain